MSQLDAMLDSRSHGIRTAISRQPMIGGDASRIEACVHAASEASRGPIALTPDEIDDQIRQFFASDEI
jgi:hypothetical protein